MQNDHSKPFDITINIFNEGMKFSKHDGQVLYFIAFMIFFFGNDRLNNLQAIHKIKFRLSAIYVCYCKLYSHILYEIICPR